MVGVRFGDGHRRSVHAAARPAGARGRRRRRPPARARHPAARAPVLAGAGRPRRARRRAGRALRLSALRARPECRCCPAGTSSRARAVARRSRAASATTPPSSVRSARASPGVSAQPLEAQIEFAERNHMPFPVISDSDLQLRDALGLPDVRDRGADPLQQAGADRRAGRDRKGLLSRVPARPERGRRARLAARESRSPSRVGLRCPGEPRPRRREAAGPARLPGAPGVGVGRARRDRVCRDDEPARADARAARRGGAVLVARAAARGEIGRRHGEGALPDARRARGRGGADALPRRAALGVPLVAVGLPAHVHVLRDRADAVPAQPRSVGDPRPGAPFPAHRADRPRGVHGHGRADAEHRCRADGRAPAPGDRGHPPADDDLDGRVAARA